jgi:uncharacterized protein YdaU (DUF1376 family)
VNYYERHIGDYARDAGHLSMLEHGAYSILLDRYYATETGIPADQAYRVARARSREERAAVDAVLSEFFTLTDGVWLKGRVQEEIAKARLKIEAARENGTKGGRPKKPKTNQTGTQQKPTGLSLGSENETQQKALQSPDKEKDQKIPPTAERGALADDPLKLMIDGAVVFMTEVGVAPKQARSVIGLLRKNVADDLIVSEILATMQQQRIAEPLAWLVKAAQSRKAGPNAPATHRESASERVARINAEAEAREARESGGFLHAAD